MVRVDDFRIFVIAVGGDQGTHLLDVLPGRGVEWMSSAAETLAIFSTTTVMTRVAAWWSIVGWLEVVEHVLTHRGLSDSKTVHRVGVRHGRR